MSLFGLLFGSDDSAQASADYQDQMGGWHNPDPPNPGRDFDPRQDAWEPDQGPTWWN